MYNNINEQTNLTFKLYNECNDENSEIHTLYAHFSNKITGHSDTVTSTTLDIS